MYHFWYIDIYKIEYRRLFYRRMAVTILPKAINSTNNTLAKKAFLICKEVHRNKALALKRFYVSL